MDKAKKERFATPAAGGTSLLVVFAVLCLTVFALLSLATVQADVRLGDASAKAVSAYYAADCEAQEILARLLTGEIPEDVSFEGNTFFYSCFISERQKLDVEVLVEGDSYTILRWQAVPAVAWEADDSLIVWDGGMF